MNEASWPAFMRTIYNAIIQSQNFLWQFTGTVGSQVINLLFGLAACQVMGLADYGLFVWLFTGFLAITSLPCTSLLLAAARYSANTEAGTKELAAALRRISWEATTIITVTITASTLFAPNLLNTITPKLAPAQLEVLLSLTALPLLTLAECNRNIVQGLLLGNNQFKDLAILRIVDAIALYLFVFIGYFSFGLRGSICMFGLSIFGRNYLATRFQSEPRKSGDSPSLPALRRYVFTMSISGALVTPALWLGTSSLLKHSGEATVAVFNIINQWRSAALLVSNTYNTSTIPSFARITTKSAFKIHLLRSTATTLLAVSVPSAFIFAAWPWTAHIYGITAIDGLYAVTGLLICNIFAALLNFSGTILSVTGNPKTNLLINGTWLVTYFTFLRLNKPITIDHFVFNICAATILVSLFSMTMAFFQAHAYQNDSKEERRLDA